MTYSYNPNIYIGSLNKEAVDEAIVHCKSLFPLEACGAISNGLFVPFENKSDSPEDSFFIEDSNWDNLIINDNIECLVHSHNDYNKASVLDQQQQQEFNIPSLIINLRQRSLMDCILFGEENPPELLGRPFFYGAFDCLSLVRDFWLANGVNLPNPPHDWEFWARAENPIEQMLLTNKDIPFKEIGVKDLHHGDILLYNMFGTKFINHMAVVSGDTGLILHHMYNNVSGMYPITYGRKYLRKVLRKI